MAELEPSSPSLSDDSLLLDPWRIAPAPVALAGPCIVTPEEKSQVQQQQNNNNDSQSPPPEAPWPSGPADDHRRVLSRKKAAAKTTAGPSVALPRRVDDE